MHNVNLGERGNELFTIFCQSFVVLLMKIWFLLYFLINKNSKKKSAINKIENGTFKHLPDIITNKVSNNFALFNNQ